MKIKLLGFIFLIFLFSCSKNDDDLEENQHFNITSEYYFAAIINGEKILYQHEVNNYGNGVSRGEGTTPKGYQQEQGMLFMKGLSQKNIAGTVLLKTFPFKTLDCSELEDMFHIGSYNFGITSTSTDKNGLDGVVIYYVDNDGSYWSSDQAPSIQNESSFEITELIDFQATNTLKTIKAKFNCNLYDENGNSKRLTLGELSSVCLYCISD